ncbi:hypothetical protein [Pseudanabaena minima]|uniref:hypothetical protein n=1 Tax=Pseudanabaena minima TaxID=890415 RepID=UPI003DA8B778
MNKPLDFLIKISSAVALVAASVVLPASPAKSAELGGLNLDGFCRSVYGASARSYLQPSRGASGWYCLRGSQFFPFTGSGKDMHAACKWQYRRTDAVAQPLNWANPYSWRCYGQNVLIR